MGKQIEGEPTETGLMAVRARVTYDKRYSAGTMHMTFADTTVKVSTGEEGKEKEIGEIRGVLGGGLEIIDLRTDKTWFISAREIWAAFQQMLDAPPEQPTELPDEPNER